MGSLLQTERARHAPGISPMHGYGSLADLSEYESQAGEPTWDTKGMLVGINYPPDLGVGHDVPEPGSFDPDKRAKSRSYKAQGRLHKRAGLGSSVPQRRATITSTPDLDALDDPYLTSVTEDTGSAPSTKIPAEYLRKNLRWLTQPRESARSSFGDLKDEIDLSRTAAENEQRSGLGIAIPAPSRGTDSPVLGDENYASGASSNGHSRLHMRSASNNSTTSQPVSTSFKPTMPFVHPIHQSPRPGMANSHANSFSSEPSSEVLTRSRGESLASAFPTRSRGESSASVFSGRAREPSDASAPRPPLKLNTSNTSSGRGSVSVTPTLRSRRGTNMSNMSRPDFSTPDLASPSSRTSIDRAFSFIRRDTDPVDPATRAASIQAARQAFQEREDAKSRKYEIQDRKAAERREQASVKVEERQRRKSDAAAKKQALEAEKRRRQRDAAATAERISSNSSAINEKVLSNSRHPSVALPKIKAGRDGVLRAPKPALVAGGRTKSKSEPAPQSAEDVAFPRVSRKRAAKSGYLRFWTWFKTRLLRIGQARRRA